jgi:hypothetical protein
MTFKRKWELFLYDIADRIFGYQMDEAYEQGIRIGSEYAAQLISISVEDAGEKAGLTKAQTVGFDVARQAIRDSKKKIHAQTGAML